VGTPTFDPVAAVYDDFIGQWTRLYIPTLLRAAQARAGQRVLDLATGTGESALMAADAVAPTAGSSAPTSRSRCCAARWPSWGRARFDWSRWTVRPSPCAPRRSTR